MRMKIEKLAYDEQGLVPAVVQEEDTDEVLMIGFMSAESLRVTFEKGLVTFWSRSRQELWTKGETSGNSLRLVRIHYNCEDNTLLVKARLEGDAVCHTGNRTCYFRELDGS
jgi:phosphoribosyl-AMP cyclohydrolase